MTKSEAARVMNAARKTHGGGAPRKKGVLRCDCGTETRERALARWPKLEGKCPKC